MLIHQRKGPAVRNGLAIGMILLISALVVGCSPTATPTPGVYMLAPRNNVFIPLRPITLTAQTVGGGYTAVAFVVNDVTVSLTTTDPASTSVIVNFSWTPPGTGEYSLHAEGIGGPGGGNRVIGNRIRLCVSTSVTALTDGFSGTGCDPVPPAPAFTSLTATPDPIDPLGGSSPSRICSSLLTVTAALNDRTGIGVVRLHLDFFAGADTTAITSEEIAMELKSDGNYYGQIDLAGVDLSALGSGEGRLTYFAFAIDLSSARVALSETGTVRLAPCVPPGSIIVATLVPTTGFVPPTDTPQPPPPACSEYTVSKLCTGAGCYWWLNNSCRSGADPCAASPDQKACEAVPGGGCKWNGLYCYTP